MRIHRGNDFIGLKLQIFQTIFFNLIIKAGAPEEWDMFEYYSGGKPQTHNHGNMLHILKSPPLTSAMSGRMFPVGGVRT